MIADPSYLLTLYVRSRGDSEAYEASYKLLPIAQLSSLQIYEFRSAVRFEVWRRKNGHRTAIDPLKAVNVLASFELDLEQRLWRRCFPDWDAVFAEGEALMERYAQAKGLRAMDALHIATAKVANAGGLLSFDAVQREVAATEGLQVLP